jgi:hypothetical protein
MSAVVVDHQDAQVFGEGAIIDAEGEPAHCVTSQVAFDDGPEVGRRPDLGDRRVKLPQKPRSEPGDRAS